MYAFHKSGNSKHFIIQEMVLLEFNIVFLFQRENCIIILLTGLYSNIVGSTLNFALSKHNNYLP